MRNKVSVNVQRLGQQMTVSIEGRNFPGSYKLAEKYFSCGFREKCYLYLIRRWTEKVYTRA